MQATADIEINAADEPAKPAPNAGERENHATRVNTGKTTLNLTMCTCNAMRTIVGDENEKPQQQRKDFVTEEMKATRGQLMGLQFRGEGMHIAGTQEVPPKETYSHFHGYMQFSSGKGKDMYAKGDKLGTALLVSANLPYAVSDKPEHYFKKNQFKVLHVSPRIMFVTMKTPMPRGAVH
eukprot:3415228-Pyramimonas_sp.AAC.1